MTKPLGKEERGLLALCACLSWSLGVLCIFLYNWKLALCFVLIWSGEILFELWEKEKKAEDAAWKEAMDKTKDIDFESGWDKSKPPS